MYLKFFFLIEKRNYILIFLLHKKTYLCFNKRRRQHNAEKKCLVYEVS